MTDLISAFTEGMLGTRSSEISWDVFHALMTEDNLEKPFKIPNICEEI